MRTGLILAIAGLTCASALVAVGEVAVGEIAVAASPGATTTASPNVTVGTWNVNTVGAVSSASEHLPWRDRLPAIVRQIVRARLDVLGVQEVSPSLGYQSLLVHGTTQFRDLRNSLNDTGLVRYALTSNTRGTSLNNRILYKPSKLRMLRQGATLYHRRAVSGSGADRRVLRPRGMVWAVFEVKATSARFLFVNTHLQPGDPNARFDQWHEQLELIKGLRRRHPHPAVVVGDYNQSMCRAPQLDPPFRRAGIPNVLDGQGCHKRLPVRAQTYRNIWLGSFNAFDRSLRNWRNCVPRARLDDSRTPCVGASIDSIFASTDLAVPYFSVVADMNEKKSKLVGTIPSDHYLVTAIVSIVE